MSCERAQNIDLPAFVEDGAGEAFAGFRAHYPRCAECSAEVLVWSELIGGLRAAPDRHPEPALLARFDADPTAIRGPVLAGLEAHLERCGPCREELRSLRAFDFTALDAAAAPLPGDVAAGPEYAHRAAIAVPEVSRGVSERVSWATRLGRRLRGIVLNPAFAYALALLFLLYPIATGSFDPTKGPMREAVRPTPEARAPAAQRETADEVDDRGALDSLEVRPGREAPVLASPPPLGEEASDRPLAPGVRLSEGKLAAASEPVLAESETAAFGQAPAGEPAERGRTPGPAFEDRVEGLTAEARPKKARASADKDVLDADLAQGQERPSAAPVERMERFNVQVPAPAEEPVFRDKKSVVRRAPTPGFSRLETPGRAAEQARALAKSGRFVGGNELHIDVLGAWRGREIEVRITTPSGNELRERFRPLEEARLEIELPATWQPLGGSYTIEIRDRAAPEMPLLQFDLAAP